MNCISSTFTAAAGAARLGSTLENLWEIERLEAQRWAGVGVGAWSEQGWWITWLHPIAVCGAHVWKVGCPYSR